MVSKGLGAGLATIALAGVGAGIRAGLKGHADTHVESVLAGMVTGAIFTAPILLEV